MKPPAPTLKNLRVVAQICNLLYRRFVIGRASHHPSRRVLTDAPQNAILRYSRLQICATRNRISGFISFRVLVSLLCVGGLLAFILLAPFHALAPDADSAPEKKSEAAAVKNATDSTSTNAPVAEAEGDGAAKPAAIAADAGDGAASKTKGAT